MSNVYELSSAGGDQEAPKKMATLEDGYYQVAHQIGIALCKARLSDRESRLVQAVMFKTFSYHKKMDWICNEQLSELTAIDIGNIGKTKSQLVKRKILVSEGKKLGLNLITEDWQLEPIKNKRGGKKSLLTLVEKSGSTQKKVEANLNQKKSKPTFGKVEADFRKSRSRLDFESGSTPTKEETITKETITKEISVQNDDPPDEINSPVETKPKRTKKPDSFKKFFAQYPAHRKGGTDAQAWKAWNSEKLADQDAEDALAWLTTTQANNPDWGTLANHQFVFGITKFIRERIWLTPMPLQRQQPQSGANWVPDDEGNFYDVENPNPFIHSTCLEDF
ncbi:replication protein [Litoribrevibacter albus]|uniref:Bacteriophage lambda Replication protein O N-terminal domain-containing protein n=1 Tax=Litoribrevibacter albus TaxID=1473156 RepID=A0AA37S952_9GAMM|nr:replication protein [Litoribrevibacter albus]GLQ31627.1 hypothetical protein GCM10007876_21060 [Litoribrevibacter albus]